MFWSFSEFKRLPFFERKILGTLKETYCGLVRTDTLYPKQCECCSFEKRNQAYNDEENYVTHEQDKHVFATFGY